MKSPAIHGALNMIYRYGITEDEAYAQKVYPYLRGVADFWEKDLVCRDGVYHVVGDGMHERTDGNIRDNGVPENPVNTLGYLKTFFTWMPRISEALDLDEKRGKNGWKSQRTWHLIQRGQFGRFRRIPLFGKRWM